MAKEDCGISEIPRTSGVYMITIQCDGSRSLFYIGKSVDMRKRCGQHRRFLDLGKHGNPIMQKLHAKYGIHSFKFSVIGEYLPEVLIEQEQKLLDQCIELHGVNSVVNILKQCVETRLGCSHSSETRRVLSERQAQNWLDPIYRESVTNFVRQMWSDTNFREMQSARGKAWIAKPGVREELAAIGIALGLDPIVSAKRKATNARPEIKAKRSASMKAACARPGARERKSEIQKIAQNRPEVKAKIAEINARPETRAKRSAANSAAQSKPEARERQREIQLIAQNRPEVKEKRRLSMIDVFKRPEVREKRKATEALPEVKAKRKAVGQANKARYQALREAKALLKV